MKTIKGPAIFLAQFAGDDPPFNSLDSIGAWAADLGYIGVYVEPDPAQIRVEEGAVVDDRGPGDTTLMRMLLSRSSSATAKEKIRRANLVAEYVASSSSGKRPARETIPGMLRSQD